LETEVVGHRLVDSWELTVMRALTKFCNENHEAIILAPIGLFPPEHPFDPRWRSWVNNTGILQRYHPEKAISMSVRCMNALYQWQTLLGSALSQAIGEAQMRFELANVREEFIMDLNTQIEALETQVQERDNLLAQCNGKLTLLEQQFNALQVNLDEALDHMEMFEAHLAQLA
jgi:hypothetical protein